LVTNNTSNLVECCIHIWKQLIHEFLNERLDENCFWNKELLKILLNTVAVLANYSSFSYLAFHASHHFGSDEESVSSRLQALMVV
jgi:hypothetical protein